MLLLRAQLHMRKARCEDVFQYSVHMCSLYAAKKVHNMTRVLRLWDGLFERHVGVLHYDVTL